MKTRSFLVIMTLIGITLACDFPGYDENPDVYSKVESVEVNPSSGTGSFTLVVTYTAFTERVDVFDTEPITCYYVTPDGATIGIGTIDPPSGSYGGQTQTGTLTLSVSDPGVYKATCDNNNSTSKASAKFSVPATLTITASSDTMTYGGTVPTIKPAYSGFLAGDTALSLDTAPTCSTTATSTSPVGSYPSSCSGAVDANYDNIYTAGSVNVTPATLTITASSDTMTYGGTVPTITPAYSGFLAGDTALSLDAAPTCSTTATSTSPVGSYSSSCSGAVGANYSIGYTPGSVSVTPTATPATWYIRVYNVDDLGTAYVNGSKITEIQFAQDSDWIDVTAYFSAPTNSVRFTMWNGEQGYAWGFAIKRDGVVVWSDVQGEVNVMGANNNDKSRTNITVYDRTIVVNQSGEFTIKP